MKPHLVPPSKAGLTLLEVVVVMVVGTILVVLLLPAILAQKHRTRYVVLSCVNNLKQVGLSYRLWSSDNNDIYPTGVSVTNGGSMEMVATGNVVQTYLAMSNELCTPRLLACPQDPASIETNTFSGLANSNISYFVSVDVTNDANPQAILSGDSNFEMGGKPVKAGLFSVWTNAPIGWTATRHSRTGNVLLGDGSVQSATATGLHDHLVPAGFATNRLAIP